MKRLMLTLAQSLLLLVVPLTVSLSGSAAAVDVFPVCSNGAGSTDVCQSVNSSKSTTNPFIKIIKVAITVIAIVVGIAAVIMIVIAGLRFVTAGGDAQAVASARSTIIYALVGLVVAVMAESLVAFVLNKL